MSKKYYSVSFKVDDIDYTVKLTDSNLSTLAIKVQKSLTIEDPLSLFSLDGLIDIQDFLKKMGVQPDLSVIINTDFQERTGILQSVNNAYLGMIDSVNPDWQETLTDEQRESVKAFKGIMANPLPIIVPDEDETLVAA